LPTSRHANEVVTWDPETNCVTAWRVPDWPTPLVFSGWGCEIGNWFGFFAHERLGGIACHIREAKLAKVTEGTLTSSWSIQLPHGAFALSLADQLRSPSQIVRHVSAWNNGREIGWIGDLVIRTVIPWEPGLLAIVDGRIIEHPDDNRCYETEEPCVYLRWPDGRTLAVTRRQEQNVPPAFTAYTYVRAQPAMPQYKHRHSSTRAWVIHTRLLVDYPAAFVYRYARNPVVFWSRGALGRFILSPKRLADRWRAHEWGRPGRGNLYGLWGLEPDQILSMNAEIRCTNG